MNKAELIQTLARRTGLTQASARAAVDALFDPATGLLAEELAAGRGAALAGFGVFEVRQRAPRLARNPRTGEEVLVPAAPAPVFRPAPALKARVRAGG